MVQRTRAHFNQHFVGFDFGIWDFGQLENFRPTMCFEDDGFHNGCKGQGARGKGRRAKREVQQAEGKAPKRKEPSAKCRTPLALSSSPLALSPLPLALRPWQAIAFPPRCLCSLHRSRL